MQKYYFQAVTKEGKQISGYVSAASMDAAKSQLKAGGLSVLTLEEPKDFQPRGSGLTVFEFEAVNNLHKTIRGTIEAADKYAAYKKLRMEYQLDVLYLVNKSLPPSEKETIKAAGIEKELEEKLLVDIKLEERRLKKTKKTDVKAEEAKEMAEIIEANEKQRVFIVEKIDSVLAEIVPLLEENAEYIDPHKRREIEERIDLVLRLKHSNSIEHLKSLTQRLLKQISEDEIFLEGANIPEDVQLEIARRKGQFQAVGNKFDVAISKGLVDLQLTLSKIDTTEIRSVVSEIRIVKRFIDTIYLSFVVLAGLCAIFLLGNFVLSLFASSDTSYIFYAKSPLIWFVLGLSLLILTSYLGVYVRLIDRWHWADWVAKFGLLLLAILVYTVQFPVLFFWTV